MVTTHYSIKWDEQYFKKNKLVEIKLKIPIKFKGEKEFTSVIQGKLVDHMLFPVFCEAKATNHDRKEFIEARVAHWILITKNNLHKYNDNLSEEDINDNLSEEDITELGDMIRLDNIEDMYFAE